MKKKYGNCKECGEPIRYFKYALTDWLCKYCYEAKFPQRKSRWLSYSGLGKSYIKNEESYEFLKEHLYSKPELYERSFRHLRDYSPLLRNFPSLRHLLDFVLEHRGCISSARGGSAEGTGQQEKDCIREIKQELVGLGKTHQWLRPQVIEILLFVLWDEMVDKYGQGERFSDGYYDLILGISQEPESVLPGLDDDNDAEVVVPEGNKDIWNYQGSKILSAAVAQGIISQLEAEVVMEKVAYERDFFDIQEILGLSTFDAFSIYQSGVSKLRKWAKGNVLVISGGQIICD